MIDGHTFIDARFVNNEKTVVESVWQDDEGNLRTHIVIAEENNSQWHELLTYIDIDSLHERTFKYIRQEDENIKDSIVEVATERGLIYNLDVVSSDLYNGLVKVLFDPFDSNEHKEKLFMLKLKLFEYPEVQSSKNNVLKSKLRKAQSPIEAVKYAIEIVEG